MASLVSHGPAGILHQRARSLAAGRRARAPRVVHAGAAAATAAPVAADAHQKLKGVQVIHCSDGARVDIPSLWGPQERAVVVWARTFGCPFCWELATQLRRDIKPGVKLFLVAIGTLERSKDFVEATGYPADRLLADPAGDTYAALGLVKGVGQTFFSYETPMALLKRAQQPGGMDDLRDILPRWKPWQPPKLDQALQQGGVFVFDGDRVAFSHYDEATGSHTDLGGVVGLVQQLSARSEAGAEECGCAAPGGGAGSG
ncbi:MAG: seleno protein U [Monoraphidium minutum]|nr:MAG: seleno protein U [Monoraphidium minutum]